MGLPKPFEQLPGCWSQRPEHHPAAVDAGHADSPSPDVSSCWCLHRQTSPIILQSHQSQPFSLTPLQQQPDSSSPRPHGCAWQAGGACSVLLGTRWLSSNTHSRGTRPSCRCTCLGLIPVRRAKLRTASLPGVQGQPRSRLPCKPSNLATGGSTSRVGVQEQCLRACIEWEPWAASFQNEATGKSPVNSFGQSRPHQKLRTRAEALSSPEQKCFRRFKKVWIHKFSKLESPF